MNWFSVESRVLFFSNHKVKSLHCFQTIGEAPSGCKLMTSYVSFHPMTKIPFTPRLGSIKMEYNCMYETVCTYVTLIC